jgi:hypothetical protein
VDAQLHPSAGAPAREGLAGKAARDAAGWHECLDLLVSDLDGTPPSAWGRTWRRVHPVYVDKLGPEAATIGPPPGWEDHGV